MQAPGFRMNEREANPNPYVGFIRALKTRSDHAEAESILKAVAAQMKKIMEQRYMFVHTLEEAAFNRVFAGRNWNHGQSIELVLRGSSGRFLPLQYIISVMCHEMAHIEQMNHGPKFQKLMAEISQDVHRLQARGHYGDGFWSDGNRLRDSAKMGAEGLRPADFPEYICGVTSGDATKARRPKRRPASSSQGLAQGEASLQSGRQTDYRRKDGRRNNVDMGASLGRLDGRQGITKEDEETRKREIDLEVEALVIKGMPLKQAKTRAAREWKALNPWYTLGNTRGKVAKSKTAAEMRAAAAEARLAALSGAKQEPKDEVKYEPGSDSGEDADADADVPDPHIDPADRKRQIESEMSKEELDGLRGGWEDLFPCSSSTTLTASSKRQRSSGIARGTAGASNGPAAKTRKTKPNIVMEEWKRGLGLAPVPGGRVVGSRLQPIDIIDTDEEDEAEERDPEGHHTWSCRLCTYANGASRPTCEMCGALPSGEAPAMD